MITDLSPPPAPLDGPRTPVRKSRAVQYRRTCPECSTAFLGSREQRFCTDAHKHRFHNRCAKRGKVAMPLMLAWRGAKSKRQDPAGSYAFQQLCALADLWNAEDRAAGRMAAGEFIKPKMAAGWRAVDLQPGD